MFDTNQIKETFINHKFERMEKSLKMYDLQEILKAIGMPDGYKAENIQIVNGKICYEEVKKSVKNIVDDYRSKIRKIYFVSDECDIKEINNDILYKVYRNALYSPEKCEQILALEQLIMNCWIVNGCRELSKDEVKACIFRYKEGDKITIAEIGIVYFILNFTSLETAQEFYETYRELIEIAKPLL